MAKIKEATRHTPGPWEIGTGWIFHKTEKRMAGNGTPLREEVCRVLTNEAGDANARLIAAAPDLLFHLKVAAKFYQDELKEIGGCDHPVNICCCDIVRELEDIQDAIAKAEGNQ